MNNATNSRINASFGHCWLVLLFSTIGLLTMTSPLYAADGSETWEQSIRDANLDSLVFISVKAKRANGVEDTFTGTGFIVDPAGYVLTCNHVIPSKNPDYVKIESVGSVGGRYEHAYPLTVVRRDEQGDVMLLKLPQRSWHSVKSIAQAQVGSPIVALGFPLDQDVVEAVGLITGVDHDGRWLTNAGLNPGMSGGPAFDRSGAVVGIVAGSYEEAKALDLLIPINSSQSLLLSVNSPLAAPRTPNPSPTSTLSSERPIPGAILEVWPLKVDFRGISPPDMSTGTLIDSGTLFNMDNFLRDKSLKQLQGKFVGLRWSGLIYIDEEGSHSFEIDRHGPGPRGILWVVVLKIDGETFMSLTARMPDSSDFQAETISLSVGFHEFEIFTYSLEYCCYANMQLRVKFRSQNSAQITLDAKNVFHKQTPLESR